MRESASEGKTELRGLDPESRQMVLDTVAQLKERLLTKEKILQFDKEERFPEKIIRQMLSPEIGLQLLFIPEDFGGMGGGARDCCEVTREMSKICLGVATAFFAIQLGADPLLVGGTKEQKEKWLGAISEGDTLVAYAVTEPGAGSNLSALSTKAEPVSDENGQIIGYNINGAKQFISTGGYADFITLLAKTPEGPTFFVVEKDTKGFDRGKGEEKHGIRASNTSPLSFTDVFIPIDNLIGGIPGQGLKQANKVFGYTRLMVAAMALGAGQAALEIAISYAQERIQFGSPLSEKQGYTHKLIVPHVVRLEAASAYIDEIAIKLDASHDDFEVEGSIAKVFTAESANRAADDAMQALGGYGYISEFEVEKIKRDVKITCIYEGTSEIQQSIISMFRWKKTWKTKGFYYQSIADEMGELKRSGVNAGCEFYELCANALNRTINLIHKNKLAKMQHIMFALADMIAFVEIGACFARKAVSLAETGDSSAEKAMAMSRVFANETTQFVSQKILMILMGSGAFEQNQISSFLEEIGHNDFASSHKNIIKDMDQIANFIFKR